MQPFFFSTSSHSSPAISHCVQFFIGNLTHVRAFLLNFLVICVCIAVILKYLHLNLVPAAVYRLFRHRLSLMPEMLLLMMMRCICNGIGNESVSFFLDAVTVIVVAYYKVCVQRIGLWFLIIASTQQTHLHAN